MIQKILIPTDFTVKSLSLVKEALERSSPNNIELLLVHTIKLPGSITDLLFFSKGRFIKAAQSEEFKASLNMLQNKYGSRLQSFSIDLFTGSTSTYLRNFLDANGITEVYMPEESYMEVRHKLSVNPIPLFKKCSIKVTEIPFNESEKYGLDDLSSVFFLKARA